MNILAVNTGSNNVMYRICYTVLWATWLSLNFIGKLWQPENVRVEVEESIRNISKLLPKLTKWRGLYPLLRISHCIFKKYFFLEFLWLNFWAFLLIYKLPLGRKPFSVRQCKMSLCYFNRRFCKNWRKTIILSLSWWRPPSWKG